MVWLRGRGVDTSGQALVQLAQRHAHTYSAAGLGRSVHAQRESKKVPLCFSLR